MIQCYVPQTDISKLNYVQMLVYSPINALIRNVPPIAADSLLSNVPFT